MDIIEFVKAWAAKHWVLWPAILIVSFAVAVAYWWWGRRRKEVRSAQLLVLAATSTLLGMAVVITALLPNELPAWVKPHSILSALGILLIALALLAFVYAHVWVENVSRALEDSHKKAIKSDKEAMAARLGLTAALEKQDGKKKP